MKRTRMEAGGKSRGISTVIGTVLLIGVVLVGVTALVGVSATVTSEQTSELARENTGSNLGRLHSAVKGVTEGTNPRVEVTFDGGTGADDSIGLINDGAITIEVGSTTYVDRRLNAVGIVTDEGTVAYQSGGIWRVPEGRPNAAEIVSAPPATALTRDNATSLSLPVYLLATDGGVSGTVEVVEQGSSRVYDPLLVPASERVRITVQSRFAAAWKQHFEVAFPDVGGRTIQYDANSNTVVLIYPAGRTTNLYLHGYVHEIVLER